MARALVDGENRTCTCRHLACELAGGLLGGWDIGLLGTA
jgi:hypothetical protein